MRVRLDPLKLSVQRYQTPATLITWTVKLSRMKLASTWLFPFWPTVTLKPDLTICLLTSVSCHYVCSRFGPKGDKCSPYQACQPRLGCEISAILPLSLKCFSKWIYFLCILIFFKKETLSLVVKLTTVCSFNACTKNSAFIVVQSETWTWVQGWIYITLIPLPGVTTEIMSPRNVSTGFSFLCFQLSSWSKRVADVITFAPSNKINTLCLYFK